MWRRSGPAAVCRPGLAPSVVAQTRHKQEETRRPSHGRRVLSSTSRLICVILSGWQRTLAIVTVVEKRADIAGEHCYKLQERLVNNLAIRKIRPSFDEGQTYVDESELFFATTNLGEAIK